MAVFKVGQRVRIIDSVVKNRVGREATVLAFVFGTHEFFQPGWFYMLAVDGLGTLTESGAEIAYKAEQLEPLANPGQESIVDKIQKMPGADFNIPGFMPEEWRRAWERA